MHYYSVFKDRPFWGERNSTARSEPMSIGLLRISGEVSTGSAAKRRRREILSVATTDVKSSRQQNFVGLPPVPCRYRPLSSLIPSYYNQTQYRRIM